MSLGYLVFAVKYFSFYFIVYFVGIIQFYILFTYQFYANNLFVIIRQNVWSIFNCQVPINYKICIVFALWWVCLPVLSICLSVCLSVCRCLRAAVAADAPKTRRLGYAYSSSFATTKAARACDSRWFRPRLVDLTTENDSRIERIVRYDQDSEMVIRWSRLRKECDHN